MVEFTLNMNLLFVGFLSCLLYNLKKIKFTPEAVEHENFVNIFCEFCNQAQHRQLS